MPSKLVADKKRYLFTVYVGRKPEDLWGRVIWSLESPFRWLRIWKLNRMSEGEILKAYYELTNRDETLLEVLR